MRLAPLDRLGQPALRAKLVRQVRLAPQVRLVQQVKLAQQDRLGRLVPQVQLGQQDGQDRQVSLEQPVKRVLLDSLDQRGWLVMHLIQERLVALDPPGPLDQLDLLDSLVQQD